MTKKECEQKLMSLYNDMLETLHEYSPKSNHFSAFSIDGYIDGYIDLHDYSESVDDDHRVKIIIYDEDGDNDD